MKRTPLAVCVSACLSMLAFAAPAAAQERQSRDYIGVIVGSQHIGNDNLNNTNPGLTFGRRWASSHSGFETHIEGGVFYNSYEEVSPITLAGISTSLAEIGPGELRVGASVGTAYYKELSESLEESYGIPNVAGFIPIASLTASYRVGRTEYRVTTVPPDTDTKAIVNFSVAFTF